MSRVGALIIGGLAEFITTSWALSISAFLSLLIGLVLLFKMQKIRNLE
jgi:hypothetical protein